jgi:hypothetical protein
METHLCIMEISSCLRALDVVGYQIRTNKVCFRILSLSFRVI